MAGNTDYRSCFGEEMKNEQYIKIMLREILCKIDLIEEMLPNNIDMHQSIELMRADVGKLAVEIKNFKEE